ncbi:putative DNA topoisomerase I [Bacteroides finegoldii]|uniref:Putative DNA topoisomerase I n=1 Tax=Bacteroides finegoldii TaxID=338188 RepID=A0A174IBR4_9BACE|nr:putative DNA topoisomerase I [Bacteroides finegoldii]
MKVIIAEKPSVAQGIASVVGTRQRKDGYLMGTDMP